MHLQKSEPGWTEALLKLPDYSVLKGFDAGLLRDGKEKWAAAGRDPKKLTTVLRHNGFTTAPRNATWEEAKAHERAQFYTFIDGTYLRDFAPFVDMVSEANEYFADSTWTDPDAAGVTQHFEAVQAVWNDEFRGKLVTNPNDHGQGKISDECRVAMGAVTVSFKFPKSLLAQVVASDNVADMHCYMQCIDGVRVPNDFRDHSGLFNVQEQETGLRPRWLFGESGPFFNTDFGWRHEHCLSGSVPALVANMQAWWRDLTTTPAYHEGRLYGAGCWFTSGHVEWPWYQLETDQLKQLADALRPIWHPGVYDPMDKTIVRQHAQAIVYQVDEVWWLQPGAKAAPPNKVIVFRNAAGVPLSPNPRPNPITYVMDIYQANDMLALVRTTNFNGTQPDWWVLASDLRSV